MGVPPGVQGDAGHEHGDAARPVHQNDVPAGAGLRHRDQSQRGVLAARAERALLRSDGQGPRLHLARPAPNQEHARRQVHGLPDPRHGQEPAHLRVRPVQVFQLPGHDAPRTGRGLAQWFDPQVNPDCHARRLGWPFETRRQGLHNRTIQSLQQ